MRAELQHTLESRVRAHVALRHNLFAMLQHVSVCVCVVCVCVCVCERLWAYVLLLMLCSVKRPPQSIVC